MRSAQTVQEIATLLFAIILALMVVLIMVALA